MSKNTQKTVIKIIAGILVALMVLTLLPIRSFAEDVGQESDIIEEESAAFEKTGKPGETAGTEMFQSSFTLYAYI
ncbi:MAG: hypothetical protein K6C08_16275 [Oscillospiraceae bacterium]|nr:hypothetical protein [Oscillospiraceae bacterium]